MRKTRSCDVGIIKTRELIPEHLLRHTHLITLSVSIPALYEPECCRVDRQL